MNSGLVDFLDFGSFRVDPSKRQLLREGVAVQLTPKAFELLLVLVRNAGSLVSKQQIVEQVWPDTHVVDSNLAFNVSVLRAALGDTARQPRYIKTIARLGYRFIADVHQVRSDEHQRSVLVLPFDNIGPGSDDDHVASGIADALIGELAQFHCLRVISRTSALMCKASGRSLPEIARSLHLDAVVEGSIYCHQDKMRVCVALTRAHSADVLWSKTYDTEAKHVSSLPREVAMSIAAELNVRPTRKHLQRLSDTQHIDATSHESYLRGLHFFHQFFTAAGLKNAVDCFREALSVDPRYPQAWAMLANCHCAMAVQSMAPARDAWPQAKDAVKQALKLSPDLPESQTAAAAVELFFGWRWRVFEQTIEKATELGPSYSGAYSLATIYAALRGRGDQAISYAKRALDLDPLSGLMHVDLGWAYMLAGKYDDAEEQCRAALDMGFAFPLAHLYLGQVHLCRKDFEQAVYAFRQLIPDSTYDDAPAPAVALLAYALGEGGKRDEAASVMSALESRRCYVSPYDRAVASLGAGLTDRSLTLLDQAYRDRSPRVTRIKVEPCFAGLRSHTGFQKLLRMLKIE